MPVARQRQPRCLPPLALALALVPGLAAAAPPRQPAARPPHRKTSPPHARSSSPTSRPPAALPVISSGKEVDLRKHLQPDGATLFVFTNTTSSVEREFVQSLRTQAPAGRTGLRLIQIVSIEAPVARQYSVVETPTVLVYDRRGNEVSRSSKLEEVSAATSQALRMARIKWVDEHDPEAAEVYRMMGGGQRPVAGILKTMSLRRDLMELIVELSQKAHFSDGYLPRRTKEMIATYVSAINHCKF
jgi:hypothetical protein